MLNHVKEWTDRTLEAAWFDLASIPVDDGGCIAKSWGLWEAGTHCEEILMWFDENHSKGVTYLMGLVD